MQTKAPHKFKQGGRTDSDYYFVIYCEYCGHVAYHGNQSKESIKLQDKAKEGCPCSPDQSDKVSIEYKIPELKL